MVHYGLLRVFLSLHCVYWNQRHLLTWHNLFKSNKWRHAYPIQPKMKRYLSIYKSTSHNNEKFPLKLSNIAVNTRIRQLNSLNSNQLWHCDSNQLWPSSSGCIIEVALGGSIRNLMWEYSWTWWLEALSQTYGMWQFESLISLLSLVMIWWCISPVIQAFFEAYQSNAMSFTCILYFFCKQWGVLDLPMTDRFLWSEPSMLVIISSVSLSLHFAETAGLSPSKQ